MNILRIIIFFYLLSTPLLMIGMFVLSFRTRNIIVSHVWLRRYVLPSLLLSVLFVVNIGLFFRLFPSVMSKTQITCVSRNELREDIVSPLGQSFVGLVSLKELDYIESANIFDPHVIGYTNELYYEYELIDDYLGNVDEEGLLKISEQQPAFLMDDYPCATLEHSERLDQGVYFVYMDARESDLPYLDEWYSASLRLFSYVMIEDYDEQLPYDMQDPLVKDKIESLLASLASE